MRWRRQQQLQRQGEERARHGRGAAASSGLGRGSGSGTSQGERQGLNTRFVEGQADLRRALGTGNQGRDETQTSEGRQTSGRQERPRLNPDPGRAPAGRARARSIARQERGRRCPEGVDMPRLKGLNASSQRSPRNGPGSGGTSGLPSAGVTRGSDGKTDWSEGKRGGWRARAEGSDSGHPRGYEKIQAASLKQQNTNREGELRERGKNSQIGTMLKETKPL